MHLSSRTDIEAPIGFVYSVLADFEAWERAGLRRGAEINRTDKLRGIVPGMAWTARFRFRGKERNVAIRLKEITSDHRLAFSGTGKMIEGDMQIELMSLSPKRTRLILHLDIRPLTLGARLFLQSVKIAKGRVQTRMNKRLETFARDLERRHAELPSR